jgi:hypothetical protein
LKAEDAARYPGPQLAKIRTSQGRAATLLERAMGIRPGLLGRSLSGILLLDTAVAELMSEARCRAGEGCCRRQ